jgi:hypothetical protein
VFLEYEATLYFTCRAPRVVSVCVWNRMKVFRRLNSVNLPSISMDIAERAENASDERKENSTTLPSVQMLASLVL